MARRHIHYEAAFQDYLRAQGWPYVAVDEHRKAIFNGDKVKSFDFLVYPPGRRPWLVDIKGRKFPYEVSGNYRYWENWVTRDDLEGLNRWESVFGADFETMFVFAYLLCGGMGAESFPSVHAFRGELYAFVVVSATDYSALARTRSPSWQTLSVPLRRFRELANPVCAAGSFG